MDILLKNILFLIESRYQNDIDFEKDFGIARSTVSAWRKGKLKSYRKMQNDISSFFGVSSDWLSGNEQKNKPLTDREKLIQECLDIMYSLPEDYQKAAREHLRSLAELSDKNKKK